MRHRVKAAWNVLCGRPTIAYVCFDGGIALRGRTVGAVLVGNSFFEGGVTSGE